MTVTKIPDTVEKRELEVRPQYVHFNHAMHTNFIYMLCLLGAKQDEIAKGLGITEPNLITWMRKYPQVAQAMKDGRDYADARVANSFYMAALGYSHPDEQIVPNRVKEYDEYGKITREYTEILRVPIIKHYPPNVTAGHKWLQARRGDVWTKDERKVEVNQNILQINSNNLDALTKQELELLRKLGIGRMDQNELTMGGSNVDFIPYEDVDDEQEDYKEEVLMEEEEYIDEED